MHTTIAEGIEENLGDGVRRPHRDPRRPRARPDRGGAGADRRPHLVGSRGARRGRRRGRRAGAPARALRHGPRRPALRALVEDLHQADGDDVHPALARRSTTASSSGRSTRPTRSPQGVPHPIDHRRGRDVRRVLRHPRARRARLPQHVQRRRGLPQRLHLPPRPRQDLLLPPRRPGLPDVPPQGRPPGHRQRRRVGARRTGRSAATRSCCATRPASSSRGTGTEAMATTNRTPTRRGRHGDVPAHPEQRHDPLRVVVAGAGGMGRAWLAAIARRAGRGRRRRRRRGHWTRPRRRRRARPAPASGPVPTPSPSPRDRCTGARSTSPCPAAHHPVTTGALFAGLPVLGEKPVAASPGRGAVPGRGRRGVGRAVHGEPVATLEPARCRAARAGRTRSGRSASSTHAVLPGPALRRVPGGDGEPAAGGHGDPPVRHAPASCSGRSRSASTARRSTRPGAGSTGSAAADRRVHVRGRRPVRRTPAAGAPRARRRRGTASWRVSG